MDVIAIITLVMKILEQIAPIIQDCVEPDAEGVKTLKQSALRARQVVYRELRKDGCCTPREARYGARYAMRNLLSACDDEVCSYIQECHDRVAAGQGEPEIED